MYFPFTVLISKPSCTASSFAASTPIFTSSLIFSFFVLFANLFLFLFSISSGFTSVVSCCFFSIFVIFFILISPNLVITFISGTFFNKILSAFSNIATSSAIAAFFFSFDLSFLSFIFLSTLFNTLSLNVSVKSLYAFFALVNSDSAFFILRFNVSVSSSLVLFFRVSLAILNFSFAKFIFSFALAIIFERSTFSANLFFLFILIISLLSFSSLLNTFFVRGFLFFLVELGT